MVNRKTSVKVVEQQKEVSGDSKELKGDKKKAFLYENYPELFKKMYPEEPIEYKKSTKKETKRKNKDLQKTDKTFVKNKYGTYSLQGNEQFNYNLKITTDMNL